MQPFWHGFRASHLVINIYILLNKQQFVTWAFGVIDVLAFLLIVIGNSLFIGRAFFGLFLDMTCHQLVIVENKTYYSEMYLL